MRKTTKSTTSKPVEKKPRKKRKDAGAILKIKVDREYPGQDPVVEFHPPVKGDPEQSAPEPKDEAAKHKFPPPKKSVVFRAKWMQFIENVSRRKNFNIGHLNALEVLCDLFVEYDELQAFTRKHGRSYKSYGRAGLVWKFYPEVQQLNRVQAQIKDYMKMLDLVLKKDDGTESGGEKEEWD